MGFFIKKEREHEILSASFPPHFLTRPVLLFFSLFCAAALIFVACVPPPQALPPQASGTDEDSDDDDDDENESVLTDNKKGSGLFSSRSRTRSRKGRCPALDEDEEPCSEDDDCMEVCDDLFSKKAAVKCGKLKPETVQSLEEVLASAEDGDPDEIETDDLDCLLSVSDKEFIKKVRKKSGDDAAKSWLAAAVSDEEMAEILNDEDGNHELLSFWAGQLEDEDPLDAFAANLSAGNFALEIAARQQNTEAWDWMMSWIQQQCRNEDYCDLPSGAEGYSSHKDDNKARELVFFCKTFDEADAGNGDVKAVLSMDAFQSRYKGFIEGLGKKCGYNLYASNEHCKAPNGLCNASSASDFFKKTTVGKGGSSTTCNVAHDANPPDYRHNNSVCYYLAEIAK